MFTLKWCVFGIEWEAHLRDDQIEMLEGKSQETQVSARMAGCSTVVDTCSCRSRSELILCAFTMLKIERSYRISSDRKEMKSKSIGKIR